MKAWRLKNPEKFRAQTARRYQRDGRVRANAWRLRNLEHVRAYKKAWNLKNPDLVSAHNKAWRRKHPDVVVAARRADRARNPERYRQYVATRRARRFKAEGSHTTAQWLQKIVECDGRCFYCLRSDVKLTRDHIIPLSRGGSDYIENIVPACKPCNSRKHDKIISAA